MTRHEQGCKFRPYYDVNILEGKISEHGSGSVLDVSLAGIQVVNSRAHMVEAN
jgi:hypothetical protein